MMTVLPEECPWDENETALRKWLTQHMAATHDTPPAVKLKVSIDYPLIPVGAPTPVLFPQLQPALGQTIDISEHASVANALGAIAGDVLLQETAAVRIAEGGAFLCSWRDGSQRSSDLNAALQACEENLIRRLRANATANQIPYSAPAFSAQTHDAQTRDGRIFLGLTLTAKLQG
jgi:hypothetical protein